VAGFTKGDAISNEAVALQKIFRSWGFASEIFCEPHRVLPEMRSRSLDVALAKNTFKPEDIAVLHLSIGSAVNDIFTSLKCRRAIIYHNMTPPVFFRGIQEEIARDLEWGRQQAKNLAGSAEVVMAVSKFNACELNDMGYERVEILPLVIDFSFVRQKPDRAVLRGLDDGKINVIFVGRGVPNKRIEDLLSAFHYFRQTVEKNSRFIHVGSYTGVERYQALIQAQARRLCIENCVFTGSVPQAELTAYYQGAHLFLCMSEHEGFCIPLIESMAHDLPVMAYKAAAVPETLAGAGVMFAEKRWDYAAEMMGRLAQDKNLRAKIIAGQRERLRRYESNNLAAELKKILAPLPA